MSDWCKQWLIYEHLLNATDLASKLAGTAIFRANNYKDGRAGASKETPGHCEQKRGTYSALSLSLETRQP